MLAMYGFMVFPFQPIEKLLPALGSMVQVGSPGALGIEAASPLPMDSEAFSPPGLRATSLLRLSLIVASD